MKRGAMKHWEEFGELQWLRASFDLHAVVSSLSTSISRFGRRQRFSRSGVVAFWPVRGRERGGSGRVGGEEIKRARRYPHRLFCMFPLLCGVLLPPQFGDDLGLLGGGGFSFCLNFF